MVWEEGSPLCLTRVIDGDVFFALMDAVFDDTHRSQWGPGFNRGFLAEAYAAGRFYTLRAATTATLERKWEEWTTANGKKRRRMGGFECHRPILPPVMPPFAVADGSTFVLPCLCVPNVNGFLAEWLWVHPRVRRRGLGTRLLRGLCLRGAMHIVGTAKPFWDAVRNDITRPHDGVPSVLDETVAFAQTRCVQLRIMDPGAWNTQYFAVSVIRAATALGHSVEALRRHEGGVAVQPAVQPSCGDGGGSGPHTEHIRSMRLSNCRNWPPNVDGETLTEWATPTRTPPQPLRHGGGGGDEDEDGDTRTVRLRFVATQGAPAWTAGEIRCYVEALCGGGAVDPAVLRFEDWDVTVQRPSETGNVDV